jgi:glycerol-3-phosphate dehydrogenase (NAD(P)+)
MNRPDIAVIGDGGWGTTLAILLSKKGFPVTLWGAFAGYTEFLNKKRVNTKFLPGIKIPARINITHELGSALRCKKVIVVAVPSQYMRQVLKKIRAAGFDRSAIFVSVTKGIEISSLKRMSQLIREELGPVKLGVLSGPTIAHEVAVGQPTTAVIASKDNSIRKYLQEIFMTARFRVYTNADVIGVEMGGSLKNVVAIACGISDGLGFGTNAKAALLARGLVEISRLGKAMSANPKTFGGISGLGDLVTTCISQYSRNRFVGEQIGRGKAYKQIKAHMQMVAEGVPTAKSAYELGVKYKVEMPIIREVYNVIYKNKSPSKAVSDLMTREKKEE